MLSKTGGRHPYGWNGRDFVYEEEPAEPEGGQIEPEEGQNEVDDLGHLNEQELQQVAGMAVDEALGVWNGVEVNNPHRDEPDGEEFEDVEGQEWENTTEPGGGDGQRAQDSDCVAEPWPAQSYGGRRGEGLRMGSHQRGKE